VTGLKGCSDSGSDEIGLVVTICGVGICKMIFTLYSLFIFPSF
jgi:hypothetical protein